MEIKGIVKGVNNKGDRYGVIIDDVWYNGKGTSLANKGDEVTIEYEVNGDWKNIKKIDITKASIPTLTSKQLTPVSMNVSYAKDIFIAIIDNGELGKSETKEIMQTAINLVKQAEKAFSEIEKEPEFASAKVEKTLQV